MTEVTSGAITFLFTDVEGSTRLLKQLRDRYGDVLAEHQRLLREAFDLHGGRVVDTQGDSFFVAFGRARDALSAAVEAQRALAEHDWPTGAEVRVRMGIHTGQAAATEQTYLGLAVHRAARISASGHGGQILLSQTTHNLLDDEEEEIPGVELRDLGEQWLKDLDRSVHLYQVAAEGLEPDFPPLRTEARIPAAAPAPPKYRRRTILIGALAGVIAAAVAIPLFAFGGGSNGGGVGGLEGNVVGLIDANTGDVEADARLPREGAPSAVAAGLGSVWAVSTDANAVYAIDPKTHHQTDKIPVGRAPAGIAVGGGFVWVTNSLGRTVSQINPQSGMITDEIRVGNGPTGIAFDKRGYVWVANTLDHSISRIRARDGNVKTFPHADVPADPSAVAVGEGAIWVASRTKGTVVKLDPQTGQRQLEPISVGQVPAAILVGAGSVWVANSVDKNVWQIDPTDGSVERVISVDDGPSGLALVGDEVWSANELGGTVSRIDAATGHATSVQLGRQTRPTAVAAEGGIVYVALRQSGAAHRGGTLRVAVSGDIALRGIDVAVGTFSDLRRFVGLTNDGLVTYRHMGGQAGYQLVPDLAARMPTQSADHKTYTFQLRPSVRYSNGKPVRASDFRHSIERGYMLRARADPEARFSGILGAERCGPRRCNLSAGIVAKDAARTVVFHLSAPNPYFLYHLASDFNLPGYVVPADTPVQEAKRPLPATGPYRVASFTQRSVRLVRNSYFHEWEKAAQPDGVPDEIVLEAVGEPFTGDRADAARRERGLKKRVALVQQQKADLMSFSLESPVDARFQYWVKPHFPVPLTAYLALATDRPPFDDPRARQALSYALDRKRVVQLVGSEDTVRPACHVLPPNFPGYRPDCPYTLDGGPRRSSGASELAKAKRLVLASGTAGTHVRLWMPRVRRSLGAYVRRRLEDLGYHVKLRTSFPPSAKFGKEYEDSKDPLRRYFIRLESGAMSEPGGAQIALAFWGADFPAASNFIQDLFSCGSIFNYARICDPALERQIKRAAKLDQDDPRRATRLWTKLDHEIIEDALVVPLFNPGGADLVSKRVGNYQYNPQLGALLSQISVR